MATKRSPYDFYPTPVDCVVKLLENETVYGNILEPCAGDGVICSTILQKLSNTMFIDAIEIDESHQDKLSDCGAARIFYKDILQVDGNFLSKYDVIITNPPFSIAQEILEHILDNVDLEETKVIMLLRLNFLGSQKRHEFWKKHLPDRIHVLSKRPSFTGQGTDSQEYAWFVWDKNGVSKNHINVI